MSRGSHTGIEVRHARGCASRASGDCTCKPSYQANVWSARDGKRIPKTFPTLAGARAWRQDAQVALRRGTMKAPSRTTVREAAEEWLGGARDGSVRNRSGDRYKPSTVRGYEQALRAHLLPDLGSLRLTELSRRDVQAVADRLVGSGHEPSTVRNALMPLRTICRRAVSRGELAVNPTASIELPAVRGRRDRVASPEEGARLLASLPSADRALWATAMYAGLRRGELQALDWEHVDLANGIIRVERSWDRQAGFVEPKSGRGRRRVPIPAALHDHLVEHRAAQGAGSGLVFGRTAERPFDPSTVAARATRAWSKAGVQGIGLHECRHTFAALMIAAGVNPKALSTYMGHFSITITLDRYGHLMPGNEEEAADLLDTYLARARHLGEERLGSPSAHEANSPSTTRLPRLEAQVRSRRA